MKQGFIDMHCHLLPAVDDGAKTLEESVRAIRMAKEQGVTEIILTPHLMPEQKPQPEILRHNFEVLKLAIRKMKIDVKLHLGNECMYHMELPKKLLAGQALTLAGTNHALIEFDIDVPYRVIEEAVESVQMAGFLPVIAHYERYVNLQKKGRAAEIKNRGAMLQMNSNTVIQKAGLLKKNLAHKDLKEHIPDLIASDCHGPEWRPYNLGPALEWMDDNLEEWYVETLIHDNAARILE